jgi:hypothetical protein
MGRPCGRKKTVILKAPFTLPLSFLPAFGYRGGRRVVALFWEPSGDEACFDDGQSYACGLCDNWLYLGFGRRPEVRRWLDEHGAHLGDSDESAQHWLLVDAGTGEVYAAPPSDARVPSAPGRAWGLARSGRGRYGWLVHPNRRALEAALEMAG